MKTKAEIEKEIEAFFCHACLDGKPATEASPDPHYCQGCYDFLAKEAELLGGRKPPWVPVDSQSLATSHQVNNEAFSGGGHKSGQ